MGVIEPCFHLIFTITYATLLIIIWAVDSMKKIIFIGQRASPVEGAGTNSWINCLSGRPFNPAYIPTTGISFCPSFLPEVVYHDCSSQEMWEGFVLSSFKVNFSVDSIIVLVLDGCDPNFKKSIKNFKDNITTVAKISLANMASFKTLTHESLYETIPKILMVTKCDRPERVVTLKQILENENCKDFWHIFETSAKTGHRRGDFLNIIRELIDADKVVQLAAHKASADIRQKHKTCIVYPFEKDEYLHKWLVD